MLIEVLFFSAIEYIIVDRIPFPTLSINHDIFFVPPFETEGGGGSWDGGKIIFVALLEFTNLDLLIISM